MYLLYIYASSFYFLIAMHFAGLSLGVTKLCALCYAWELKNMRRVMHYSYVIRTMGQAIDYLTEGLIMLHAFVVVQFSRPNNFKK